ncbi:thioredoxin [Acaromyces ingoldii]|uniref:Thioredoxin n=1 Tax=Acaromyces ingoldii TaxID=215250 RepID=A0A316YY38_9BASI|nr:thioredoxin [Acaromyces ingoldii]PWN94169.1 thioredoxin [Acaromyces ingoldii]
MSVKPITSYDDFKKIIAQDKVTAIDFWATWCGPCKMISPMFEKLAGAADADKIEFYKVDVDEQGQIAEEVGIKAMPTFVFFKDGKKIKETVGANPGALDVSRTSSLSLVDQMLRWLMQFLFLAHRPASSKLLLNFYSLFRDKRIICCNIFMTL